MEGRSRESSLQKPDSWVSPESIRNAELYEGFVESVYGWKETGFPVTEDKKERLNGALGELAKACSDGDGTRFRLTHWVFGDYLAKPGQK
jgi:hypothetical protein